MPQGVSGMASERRTARAPRPRWGGPAEVPTTVLAVRHGTTAHSHEGLFSGRNDLPLDGPGRAQARAAAELLAVTGVRGAPVEGFDAVLASPLRRARETAEVIAERLDVPMVACDALTELDFGVWEGRSYEDARRGWPVEFAAWLAREEAPCPDGEAFAAVTARTLRFLDQVRTERAGQRLVAVSHLGPIKTLLRLALGAPHGSIFQMSVETGSVSTVDYFADGSALVRGVNRTP